jgi:hypothetical protein
VAAGKAGGGVDDVLWAAVASIPCPTLLTPTLTATATGVTRGSASMCLREITHLVFRVDRDARPVLKAELNKAISMRAKLKRAPWWN